MSQKELQPTEELQDTYVDFKSRAVSHEAEALIDRLYAYVTTWEEGQKAKPSGARRGSYKRGPAKALVFKEAVERFIANLLQAAAYPDRTGKVYRSLKRDGFTGEVVTAANFRQAMKALVDLDLITHHPGTPRFKKPGDWFDAGGYQLHGFGKASIFTATQKLLTLADEFKISHAAIDDHFQSQHEELQLRASNRRSGGDTAKGRPVEVPETPVTAKLRAEVQELNGFLKGFKIDGGRHYKFIRRFNEADNLNTYGWNKGGRLYSVGERSYQTLGSAERKLITIDGEPTVELDVSASYLTIFYALRGKRLNIQEEIWDRINVDNKSVAKKWVNLSLTTGKPLTRWPKDTLIEFREEAGIDLNTDYRVRTVGGHARVAFPELYQLEASGITWADLMYLEGVVIIEAMRALMSKDIPSLPVFDSLIVPQSQVGMAAGILYDVFYERTGAPPRLKANSDSEGLQREIKEALADDDRYVSAVHL